MYGKQWSNYAMDKQGTYFNTVILIQRIIINEICTLSSKWIQNNSNN